MDTVSLLLGQARGPSEGSLSIQHLTSHKHLQEWQTPEYELLSLEIDILLMIFRA